MRRALPSLLLITFALWSAPGPAAQSRPIRGFPDDAVAAQRQREEQFRKFPDSARLKEYMEAMASDSHVAGQPSSKRVADYALAKFKSFGLDARLEEFEALMPWPIETTVEVVGPEKSHASA